MSFTASNGLNVTTTDDPASFLIGSEDPAATKYIDPPYAQALREFFENECDGKLSRWRSPAHPGLVVYPVPDTTSVRVLNERDVTITMFYRGDTLTDSNTPAAAAARAYFAAHPEPRPWHNVTPNEFWDLTVEGFPDAQEDLWRSNSTEFVRVSDVGRVPITDPRITAGERIWPKRT